MKDVFPVLFESFCYLSRLVHFYVVNEKVFEVLFICTLESAYTCPEFRRSGGSVCLGALYEVVPVSIVVFLEANKNVSPENVEIP